MLTTIVAGAVLDAYRTVGRAVHRTSERRRSVFWKCATDGNKLKPAFAIVSVEGNRADNRRAIRERLTFFPEAERVRFFDGHDAVLIDGSPSGCAEVNVDLRVRIGNLGFAVELLGGPAASAFDALFVLKVDAVVDPQIGPALAKLFAHVLTGWDGIALHVPAAKADDFHRLQCGADGFWMLVDSQR